MRRNTYLTSVGYTNANNKDVSPRLNSLPACTSTPDVVYAVTPPDREKPRALVMEAGPASSIRTLKYYPERRAGFLHSRADDLKNVCISTTCVFRTCHRSPTSSFPSSVSTQVALHRKRRPCLLESYPGRFSGCGLKLQTELT
jgi:hypothetical protein